MSSSSSESNYRGQQQQPQYGSQPAYYQPQLTYSYVQPGVQYYSAPYQQPLYYYSQAPVQQQVQQSVVNQPVQPVQQSIIQSVPQVQYVQAPRPEQPKTQTHIEYYPQDRVEVEYEQVERKIKVPVQKTYTDYYAVETVTEVIPQIQQQTYIEYVPYEKTYTVTEYQPVQRVQQNTTYQTAQKSFTREIRQEEVPKAQEFVSKSFTHGQFANQVPTTSYVQPAVSYVQPQVYQPQVYQPQVYQPGVSYVYGGQPLYYSTLPQQQPWVSQVKK